MTDIVELNSDVLCDARLKSASADEAAKLNDGSTHSDLGLASPDIAAAGGGHIDLDLGAIGDARGDGEGKETSLERAS